MLELNDETYESYALRHYDNPKCRDLNEFKEDLEERPKWIKRLLRKYHNGGELREILILNHIIGFYNTFPGESGTRLLMYKMEKELYPYLKSFLLFLNYSITELEYSIFTNSLGDEDRELYIKERLGKIVI